MLDHLRRVCIHADRSQQLAAHALLTLCRGSLGGPEAAEAGMSGLEKCMCVLRTSMLTRTEALQLHCSPPPYACHPTDPRLSCPAALLGPLLSATGMACN